MTTSLLAVHPHPDDEAIATGGILLKYGALGVATHVVTCTGGEAGENLAGIELGDRPMVDVRREEMAAAIRALGLTSHAWLGYRDSGMVDTPDNDHPDAFVNADLDEAATRLAGHVRRRRPRVVVSDDERGTYGHPDHVKAHHVTVSALAIAADPDVDVDGLEAHEVSLHVAHAAVREDLRRFHEDVTSRGLASPFDDDTLAEFGTPAAEVTMVVDVRDQLEGKRAAMRAHRSQVGEDSFFLNVPDDVFGEVFGREAFTVVASARPLTDQDLQALASDLFAGRVS